jgi:hypothetical protein
MTEWTKEHQREAQAEGWDIFEVGRSETYMYELERIDHPSCWDDLDYTEPKFEEDAQVWAHVFARARDGSQLHLDAVAFLREHSPDELAFIAEHS